MREGTTSRVMVADKPYGELYDFYSISPENFGSILILGNFHQYEVPLQGTEAIPHLMPKIINWED